MAIQRGKIVIIGAGHVGSAILNSLLGMNLAREIVLVNLDREQALGEVLDASHTLSLVFAAGCAVFAVTAFLYDSISRRMSSAPPGCLSPAVHGLGLYLASQCLQGLL